MRFLPTCEMLLKTWWRRDTVVAAPMRFIAPLSPSKVVFEQMETFV